jgi:hypothetical protein
MTPIVHYGSVLKISTYVFGALSAVAILIDPTIKVALIMSIPGIVTGLSASYIGYLNHLDNKLTHASQQEQKNATEAIGNKVDGKLSRILDASDKKDVKLADQSDQLTVAKVDLSHAEGRREGIESTEPKTGV